MGNNRSKRSKDKIKGSAPKKTKEPTPVPETDTTTESVKGVPLDKVEEIIRNDKVGQFNHFFTDINFDYKSKESKEKKKKVKVVKVDPLPTSLVLTALENIWDINNPKIIAKGMKENLARFYAGSTIKEIMLSLENIIPDAYNPKGKVGKALKTQKHKHWKSKAVGKEAMNRRLKELLVTGDVVFFSFDSELHFVPYTRMVSDKSLFYGSVYQIEQIKMHLFDTKQWLTLYRNWFITKFDIPMKDMDLESFEDLLASKTDEIKSFFIKLNEKKD